MTPPVAAAEGLCCPACRAPFDRDGGAGRCARCGRPAAVRGGRVVDFEPGWTPTADAILEWPDEFLAGVEGRLADPGAGADAELCRWGLADGRGALTAAGRIVAYHLAEFPRQGGVDGVESFCEVAGLGPSSSVLDVGCGAGQTLRALDRREPGARTGVDVEPHALALGARLPGASGPAVRFVRASAVALPFPDGAFTHVVCRVALNYMRQGPALGEMVRVLAPGGYLYCRVEGPGFDLRLVAERRGGNRRALAHLRNLFWGGVLEATGWQPAPGRRAFKWDRSFATARRLGKALRRDCVPVRAAATGRYLGLPVGAEVVVRKRPTGRGARETCT